MPPNGDNSERVHGVSPKNRWTIGKVQSMVGTILRACPAAAEGSSIAAWELILPHGRMRSHVASVRTHSHSWMHIANRMDSQFHHHMTSVMILISIMYLVMSLRHVCIHFCEGHFTTNKCMSHSPIHTTNKISNLKSYIHEDRVKDKMVMLDVKGVWQLNHRITFCIYCQCLNDMFHNVGKEDFVNAACGKHFVVTSWVLDREVQSCSCFCIKARSRMSNWMMGCHFSVGRTVAWGLWGPISIHAYTLDKAGLAMDALIPSSNRTGSVQLPWRELDKMCYVI